jgi:tetratricopeptide (TPR) repeat protein
MPSPFVRIRRCGVFAATLLAAGCASTGNGGNETLWQKMIPGDQSTAASPFPNAGSSRYLAENEVQVKIGETPAPKKIKDPAKLNLKYGRWQEQMGQLNEARRAYDLVLKEEPKSVDAILGIARLDQLGGRTRDAEAGFLRAAKLKPNDANVHDAVGQYYAANEKWGDAIKWSESALSLSKANPGHAEDATIEFHLATAKAKSGDLPGSLPHFVNSVGEAEGHFNIGYILYEKGSSAAAALEFERALAISPDLQQAQAMLDEIRGGQPVQQTSGTHPSAQPPVSQSSGASRMPFSAPRTTAALKSAFRPAKLQVSNETRPAAAVPGGPAASQMLPLNAVPQQSVPLAANAPKQVAANPAPQMTPQSAAPQGATISADFSGNGAQPSASAQQQEQWQNQFGAGHQR